MSNNQRSISVRVLLSLLALVLMGTMVVAQEEGHRVFISTGHYYKLVVTDTAVNITSSTTWIDLPGATPAGTAYAIVRPNSRALVNVRFTAESRCTEANSVSTNWCETRVLIGGAVASPGVSASPFAFDSTDMGSETAFSYEAHAMDRHRCVTNTTAATIVVPVQVQWQVTNFDGGAAPSFWLDDWSLTIETAQAISCPPD